MPLLVKEHYKIAEKNGIGRNTLENRVYNLLMDVDKAITMPIQRNKDSLWKKYRENAVVAQSTFYERVKKGIPPEIAASTFRVKYPKVRERF